MINLNISKITAFLLVIWLFSTASMNAQSQESVQWLTFEQLDDSLATTPKKVFVDFYTDWCTYCRKMDKVVFTNPEVIEQLNTNYHAVRMDAESADTIYFEGQPFINDQLDKSRTPIHQIAQLLAMRNGQFAPPAMIILDKEFRVEDRYFQYLSSKKLLKALE